MKVIIAGDREITDSSIINRAVEASSFTITEVVEGGARGVDRLAKEWAKSNGISVTTFPANWKDISRQGANVKKRKNEWTGKMEEYDAAAGVFRNEQMASYADALIAIQTNGQTPGTQNMISLAKKYNLKVFIYEGEDSDYEYVFGQN